MHLYKTPEGALLVTENNSFLLTQDWDQLVNQSDLHQHLKSQAAPSSAVSESKKQELIKKATAPIGSQEVWASGVTYLKSRDARMEESKESGAADVYQKVYEAERPELFFKSLPHRVVGPEGEVFIRRDSTWNVPEPELTLFMNSAGAIQGYTIGNDMSSRSIEGENPLYLPQAKMYERSCALGPCLYVPAKPIAPETNISIKIERAKKEVFSNSIQLNRMKRNLPELATWLYKALKFSTGSFLMTGTGIVPSNDFTLQAGDEISIEIEGIGVLRNSVGVI
jgi:2-dehydro-3-deoxy-D-arabinonate dehydratase